MHTQASDSKRRPVLGAVFLLHFVAVCLVKLTVYSGEEIWWLSHISLALAGLGLVLRSTLLPAAALTTVLVMHSIWLVDCAAGLSTGAFPIGVTSYVQGADAWVWLGTAHHFYLLPLLLLLQIRRPAYPNYSLLLSAAVYALLTAISRLWLPAEANVNYAFVVEVLRTAPHVAWANGLPPVFYLLVVNVFISVGFFFPTSVFLQRWFGARAPRSECLGVVAGAV